MGRVQVSTWAARTVHPGTFKPLFAFLWIALVALWLSRPCVAALLLTDEPSVTPVSPPITFSEYPVGTVNPVYSLPSVSGYGDLTISFGTHFVGQTVGSANSLTDTTPIGPLTLSAAGPKVATALDLANPNMPGLGGKIPMGFFDIFFSTPRRDPLRHPGRSLVLRTWPS